jgi:hypothetical protein
MGCTSLFGAAFYLVKLSLQPSRHGGSYTRSPEIDLLVLPRVPPVGPACAQALETPPAESPMPRAAADDSHPHGKSIPS